MAEKNNDVIDVRGLQPWERHKIILEKYKALKPNEKMQIINDHYPVHLIHFMKHEFKNFDESLIEAQEINPNKWLITLTKGEELAEVEFTRVEYVNIDKVSDFNEERFNPIPVYATNEYRVMVVLFKPNQFIPIHTPSIDLIFYMISGNAEIIADDKRIQAKSGDLIIVPKGKRRGIKALTEVKALHIVVPPPSHVDHEEVERKLEKGVFE